MQRLRKQEEQREYERMINPPPEKETFGQRFPHSTFNPNTYHGQTGVDDAGEEDHTLKEKRKAQQPAFPVLRVLPKPPPRRSSRSKAGQQKTGTTTTRMHRLFSAEADIALSDPDRTGQQQ